MNIKAIREDYCQVQDIEGLSDVDKRTLYLEDDQIAWTIPTAAVVSTSFSIGVHEPGSDTPKRPICSTTG